MTKEMKALLSDVQKIYEEAYICEGKDGRADRLYFASKSERNRCLRVAVSGLSIAIL